MVEPKNKLPFKQKMVRQKYILVDANNSVVVKDIEYLATALYLEEAANNYQKVREALLDIWSETSVSTKEGTKLNAICTALLTDRDLDL